MPVINQAQTTNAYPDNQTSGATAALISQVFNSRGGWFSVSAAAAFVEMQYGPQGSSYWTQEVLVGNGAFAYLDPKCTGVRFRSAVSGVPATITAQISQGDEPPLSIVALGQLSVVGLSLIFQHNDVAAGTEPILDFMDSSALVWTMTDDVPGTRMKVTPAFPVPLVFTGAAAATLLTEWQVTGDTQPRHTIAADGTLTWGPGAAVATDTTVARIAAGVVQIGKTGQGGRWAAQQTAAGNLVWSASVDGDTTARLQMFGSGNISWGPGNAGADLTVSRNVTGPPSSGGGPFLSTAQSFLVTSTTGYVYASATNNQAFGSYLASADANPAFKVFTQGALAWGPGGASALDLEIARVVNSPTGTGTFLELINGDGLGYGTGTGGTVTQLTSFSTGVTLNKPTGKITLFTSAISAGLLISFTVTCSPCGIDDTVVLSGDNMAGVVMSASVAAGSFVITWYANGALASATRKINYAIVKGAVA